MVGQIEAALLDGDVRQFLFTPTAFELLVFGQDGGFKLAVFIVGKFQEDQAQHRGGVLAGLQVGIGAQAVGFEFLELFFVHDGWRRDFEEIFK